MHEQKSVHIIAYFIAYFNVFFLVKTADFHCKIGKINR